MFEEINSSTRGSLEFIDEAMNLTDSTVLFRTTVTDMSSGSVSTSTVVLLNVQVTNGGFLKATNKDTPMYSYGSTA